MAEQDIVPLFRGATKPVLFFGVPVNALVLAVLPFAVATTVTWLKLGFIALLFLLPAVVAVVVMRDMTKRDDQYLNMWIMNMREKSRCGGNKVRGVCVIPPRPLRDRRFVRD